jgi:hypothetical protein
LISWHGIKTTQRKGLLNDLTTSPSNNFDRRGANLSTGKGLSMYSAELAQKVVAFIEADI